MSTKATVQSADNLGRLDALIATYSVPISSTGSNTRGPCDLLVERLQAARRCLLGNMTFEYEMNLKQAVGSLDCISEKTQLTHVRRELEHLRKQTGLK